MLKSIKLRRVVALSMVLSAAVLTYTGLMLYIAPHGRVAYWIDWHLLGLSKEQLGAVHTTNSFLFVVMGLLHTYYNWKPIKTYLKNKAKQWQVFNGNSVVALLLVGLFAVGSVLHIPPMAQVLDLGEVIKDWWEQRESSPPYGHAELSTLSTYARREGLDADRALEVLREAGIDVTGADQTLLDISRANGTSPAAIAALIEDAGVTPAGSQGGGGESTEATEPALPPAGLGKVSLEDHCRDIGLDVDQAIRQLGQQGVTASPDETLRGIAERAGKTPRELAASLDPAATERD
jgi:Domain of unknown function (DUF4405)